MVWRVPFGRMSGMLVFPLVFNGLRRGWRTTFRGSLFFLTISNGLEGAVGPHGGNVSFLIGFQWFARGVEDYLSRIIVFPKDFQWFGGSRWPGCLGC